MILKQCLLTKNECYIRHTPIKGAKPTGIVVHDTAGGNPWLKRYVQPSEDTPNAAEVLKDLGKNTGGNDWNQYHPGGKQKCVHAFIGKNAAGVVEVYQTLPYDICCWGVGDGSKGSYNWNPRARIQFEICDDYKNGKNTKEYFDAAFRAAIEYCAYLCNLFGLDVSQICNHHEAWKQGYGCNHSDTDTWMAIYGKNMDWFRAEVQKELDKEDEDVTKEEVQAMIDASAEKVYHYWNQLPGWAYAPIMALYQNGYFSGRSTTDLDLNETLMRSLVCMASALKKNGIIDY